ncbi:MAG TPA: threonine/serine exporter family protein [Bacillales bacterium]|nr:threonine/serine exporter family protein [Bacillales bacterium]
MWIQPFLMSFAASAGFGLLFNVPRKSVVPGAVAGMIGWVLYKALSFGYDINVILATAVSSFVVAGISQVFARFYKMPVIVFSVAGIIPLVPGGLAYSTMRDFVANDYNTAIGLAAEVFLLSGAIAFGLVLAGVMTQILFKRQTKA